MRQGYSHVNLLLLCIPDLEISAYARPQPYTLHIAMGAAAEEQPPAVPAAGSDAVAEAGLSVVVSLLCRTHLQSGEQLLSLLPRLLRIATLPRSAAAEEVRRAKSRIQHFKL